MTPPNKWLFFPTPAATGPLQTITWNMTGASNATVSSTGSEIINPDKTSGLKWSDGKARFWNGSAAVGAANYDASSQSGTNYYFTSGTTCREWWHLYAVSVTLNGGSSIDLNATSSGGSGNQAQVAGSVQSSSAQTRYINVTNAIKGSAFVSGDVVVFTVTAV